MSKFSKAFGEKYEQNKLSLLTRTFELGNHTFKVRIPSVGGLEAIYNYGNNPDIDKVEAEYQNLIYQTAITDEGETVVILDLRKDEVDGDVVIEGRSMRETAKNKAVLQHRITEYFKLLIPDTDASLDDLEYSDIEAEFPLAVQMEFVEKINQVIAPDYKETRGK